MSSLAFLVTLAVAGALLAASHRGHAWLEAVPAVLGIVLGTVIAFWSKVVLARIVVSGNSIESHIPFQRCQIEFGSIRSISVPSKPTIWRSAVIESIEGEKLYLPYSDFTTQQVTEIVGLIQESQRNS